MFPTVKKQTNTYFCLKHLKVKQREDSVSSCRFLGTAAGILKIFIVPVKNKIETQERKYFKLKVRMAL